VSGRGNYCNAAGATKLKSRMDFFLLFYFSNVQKVLIKEINKKIR